MDNVETIFAGSYNSIIMKKDKSYWGFGKNDIYQID